MSGGTHMNPRDVCASCWREKWNAALAELDALRIKAKTWQIRTDTWMAKAASLEGERNASEKRIVRLQEDIVAMKKHHANLEAERDALRAGSDEDARALLHLNDLLTAAESEVARLRAEGLAIADGQIADRARLEAERDEWRDTARNEMAGRRAAEAVGALREWREAESLPDCAACSVLDAALAGALA